ncbi:MAG TPA: hypothetical protein PLN32_08955 [Methanoregulaceae archaeon]|nr:hypothetical protein [Methanoregulaceae archaeon]
MASPGSALLTILVPLIISTIIIYVIVKLLGEEEGIITALLAAIAGTVIYAAFSFLLGPGWIAALIAGIVWLLALRSLYKIGWLKSLVIAVVIWSATTIVGWFLPTLMGPV